MLKLQDGIEYYEIEGQALDNAWIAKNREMLESHVYDDMRSRGIVPVLDNPPVLTSTFDAEREIFEFKIGAYGYPMGDRATDYLGIIFKDGILVSADAKRVALADGEGI